MSKDSEFYKKLSGWRINEAKRLYVAEDWHNLMPHLKKEFPVPKRSICFTQGFNLAKARKSRLTWDEPTTELGNFNFLAVLFCHMFDNNQIDSVGFGFGIVSDVLSIVSRAEVLDAAADDFPGLPRFKNVKTGTVGSYVIITYWLSEDGQYRARGGERHVMP